MREKTYKVAFGGVVSAAAVAVMFLGSVIPFATFAAPAIAGFCVMFFAVEFNSPTAFGVYAAVSLLSFFLVPDKEVALLFICFFGFYPIIKFFIDRKLAKIIGLLSKFAIFNACILLLYYLLVNIFTVSVIRDEFAEYSTAMIIVMLVLGNIAFFFYDILLMKCAFLYTVRIKPKMIKNK